MNRGCSPNSDLYAGQTLHLLVDQGASQQLLAGQRMLRIGLAVGGEQQATDAAQPQRVGVPEGPAQQLRGQLRIDLGAAAGGLHTDLDDGQQVGDQDRKSVV